VLWLLAGEAVTNGLEDRDGATVFGTGVAYWRLQGGLFMESKPAQNIQDSFLNTARKDKSVITIYLLSGVKLTGRIRSFDKYSVVLDTNNQEQLIFKHAISTVVMSRPHSLERHMEPRSATEGPASPAAPHPAES